MRQFIGHRIAAVVLAAVIALTVPLTAQTTVGPTSKFLFDVSGPASLAEAQSLQYRAYVVLEGQTAPNITILTPVVCTAPVAPATAFTCSAPIPAATQGRYTTTLTVTVNGLESAQSNSTTYMWLVFAITNLRVG